MRKRAYLPLAFVLTTASRAWAGDADPTTLDQALVSLAPGDTLHLAAGTYPKGLTIDGLNGSESAPITITGPEPPSAPAVFEPNPSGCCNNVEITQSSYVVLKNVTVDSKGMDGIFGVSAKGGTSNVVHHITIEGCTLTGQGASQQTVGISTKTPTWGWTIRGNRIVGPGTGLYLGNSDGSCPFVAGTIEYNLVQDPVGYCMEIKWQQPRPTVAGMPTGDSVTIVRHNVFIKNDQPSPDGDRPNVLFGGFPDTGPGAGDLYEVYGNLFAHNPRESLVQASGRVSIHDNVFVDVAGTALLLQNHDLVLRLAHVYNNTVYAAASGIRFGSTASQGDGVVGNLVFAATPIGGSIQSQRDNLTDIVAQAASYVTAPSTTLGSMDFYPKPGQCEGTALDLSAFASELDYDRDFNGTSKGGYTFRGAYTGTGTNPGWKLAAEIPSSAGGASAANDAGTDAGAGARGRAPGDASGSAGRAPASGGEPESDAGCACRVRAAERGEGASVLLVLLLAALRRPRRSTGSPPAGS
jgi:hypothetical protein